MAWMWSVRLRTFLRLPVSLQTYFHIDNMRRGSLQDTEHGAILEPYPSWHFPLTILDSLKWLTDQTTSQSVGEIVAEATTGALMEETAEGPNRFEKMDPNYIPKSKLRSFYCFRHAELILSCIRILEAKICATDSGHDPNNIATWENLTQIVFEAASDGYSNTMPILSLFTTADHLNDIALSTRILETAIVSSEDENLGFLTTQIGSRFGAVGAEAFLHKFPDLRDKLFYRAAGFGNVNIVTAIVDDHPSIISIRDANNMTALDYAARSGYTGNCDVIDFLLQRGAERPPHLLHELLRELKFIEALHLLERGWSPFLKDESGTSAIELASQLNDGGEEALHQQYDSVGVLEHQTRALGVILKKMKLMQGEQSNPD
ncbi:hypothetical protein DXG01_003663 [Tephrocybe rancida]|nr:hypothetical protein DXG01_003663 [Tephrocybe rancida]